MNWETMPSVYCRSYQSYTSGCTSRGYDGQVWLLFAGLRCLGQCRKYKQAQKTGGDGIDLEAVQKSSISAPGNAIFLTTHVSS